MDRDQICDRAEKAYYVIAFRQCETFNNVEEYINGQYEQDIVDEFLTTVYNQETQTVV